MDSKGKERQEGGRWNGMCVERCFVWLVTKQCHARHNHSRFSFLQMHAIPLSVQS